jgi:DNA-binding MarR family transcriptional regulator
MTKALQRVTITPKQVNMTDIKRTRTGPAERTPELVGVSSAAMSNAAMSSAAAPDVSASETGPHVAIVELLFFAYRDFTAAADEILSGYGLGRAHHRVLHFVHRNPGLRVADLLDLLRITKQSLARVLKQLIDEGWIAQRATVNDRRVRHLYTTARGRQLAERLIALQSNRVGQSLAAADEAAVRQFLSAMVSAPNRAHVAGLIKGNAAADIERETVQASGRPADMGAPDVVAMRPRSTASTG